MRITAKNGKNNIVTGDVYIPTCALTNKIAKCQIQQKLLKEKEYTV